jgi:hypothetical protein
LSNFYIKQNALSPAIPFQFTQGNGLPIDLTGDTVSFRMRLETGTSLVVNTTATIDIPGSQGTGYYAWQGSDTAVPGRYVAEWVRTHAGVLEILPVVGYDHVIVTKALP